MKQRKGLPDNFTIEVKSTDQRRLQKLLFSIGIEWSDVGAKLQGKTLCSLLYVIRGNAMTMTNDLSYKTSYRRFITDEFYNECNDLTYNTLPQTFKIHTQQGELKQIQKILHELGIQWKGAGIDVIRPCDTFFYIRDGVLTYNTTHNDFKNSELEEVSVNRLVLISAKVQNQPKTKKPKQEGENMRTTLNYYIKNKQALAIQVAYKVKEGDTTQIDRDILESEGQKYIDENYSTTFSTKKVSKARKNWDIEFISAYELAKKAKDSEDQTTADLATLVYYTYIGKRAYNHKRNGKWIKETIKTGLKAGPTPVLYKSNKLTIALNRENMTLVLIKAKTTFTASVRYRDGDISI